MKWVILIIIAIIVGVWLARGRRKQGIENPEAKTVEKQDYYISPEDEAEQGRVDHHRNND